MARQVRIPSTRQLMGDIEDAGTTAAALREITLGIQEEDPENQDVWDRHDEARRAARELVLIEKRLAKILARTPENQHAGARTYHGSRGNGARVQVEVRGDDGARRVEPLDCRNDLTDHSPDGAEWGYPGSGPTQLALGILADATGDDGYALRRHQDFKREVIQRITAPDWTILGADVAAWAEDHP